MSSKNSKHSHSQCSLLKHQLYKDLNELSKRELEELGAWHGSISQTVDYIAIGHGCKQDQTEYE